MPAGHRARARRGARRVLPAVPGRALLGTLGCHGPRHVGPTIERRPRCGLLRPSRRGARPGSVRRARVAHRPAPCQPCPWSQRTTDRQSSRAYQPSVPAGSPALLTAIPSTKLLAGFRGPGDHGSIPTNSSDEPPDCTVRCDGPWVRPARQPSLSRRFLLKFRIYRQRITGVYGVEPRSAQNVRRLTYAETTFGLPTSDCLRASARGPRPSKDTLLAHVTLRGLIPRTGQMLSLLSSPKQRRLGLAGSVSYCCAYTESCKCWF